MRFMMKSVGIATSILLMSTGFAQAEEDEEKGWKADIGLAFSAQTGTTDTVAGTLDMKTSREWELDVVDGRFLGSYGTSREKGSDARETNQDSQVLSTGWKHTFASNDRLFIASAASAQRDGTQDLDVRFKMNSGPGVRVWQGADPGSEHFDLAIGAGYRHEIFDGNGNDPGSDKSQDNFADGVIGFEYKNGLFDDKLEFTHTGSARMPFNNINAYILTTEVQLGVPLTEAWSLRAGFLAEYVKVTTDPNNELTTRTTIGLGYTF